MSNVNIGASTRSIEVLLTSEQFIKEVTNLSDNLSGKLLLPAIREAQQFGLKNLVGNKIYSKLIELVADGSIDDDDNEDYKDLLDLAQYYLAYTVASNIVLLTAVKVDNLGVTRLSDTNVTGVDFSDLSAVRGFYQSKADYYMSMIQKHLKDSSFFNDKYSCNTNTYSSASTGLWLGGYRGRQLI